MSLPEARREKKKGDRKVRKEREEEKRKIGSRFEIGHGRRRTGHGFGGGITWRINDAGSLEATEHGSIRRDYES